MRTRDLLHKSKLQDFIQYAESKGYKEEPTKGEYEVLRLRGSKGMAIFHERLDRGDHFTTHGLATELVEQYIRDKKHGNQNP